MVIFNSQNRHDNKVFEQDTTACPKCQGPLTRHLVWSQENQRIYTYHCEKDGDVVPVVTP